MDKLRPGDAQEGSFYAPLEDLIESIGEIQGKRIRVTALPKKYEGQLPDFRVRAGRKTIGHIEAKDFQKYPEDIDIDRIEDSNQLKKYRKIFPNLILTNFFEFRLYRKGILVEKIQLERPFIAYKLKTAPSPSIENQKKLLSLLSEFFTFSTPETKTAKQLAIELADRTSFLKEKILEEIRKKNPDITGFFRAFKKHLIATLTEERFADIYAQTITYGLFVARTRANQEDFGRDVAVKFIPRTIPLLKKVFAFISSTELPESMEWIVDEISQVLTATNVSKIIHDFYKKRKGKDPVIHFYETFLAEYDPKERERRGVYYTPEPVVSYIVRSIHKILKKKFDKKDGFATSSVTVLDPAAGTLTFPAEAIRLIREEIEKKYGPGVWRSVVKDHILKNFYAFELLMAPYVIGHLKISLLLEELGYTMKENEKFNLYLTNTLEMELPERERLPGVFERYLAEEFKEAKKVKTEIPILVVMGNPPYSVSSTNKSRFIEREMKLYKEDVKGEKWLVPLGDDYIKFIRFAHWKIGRTPYGGIIGIITNNSYLSGLIHRGMRHKLLDDFSEIYILNLHGDSRKKEKTPEGGKDENVFDIQQGVAIAIFVKLRKRINGKPKIYYMDLWGSRNYKYEFLRNNDITTVKSTWERLSPEKPYFFLIPKQFSNIDQYRQYLGLKDIFIKVGVGVKTSRDDFVISKDKKELERRMEMFVNDSMSDDLIKQTFSLKEGSRWSIKRARDQLRKEGVDISFIIPYSYRIFDKEWIYYSGVVVSEPGKALMKNLLKENVAIVTTRQVSGDSFQHAFITDSIGDMCFISNRGRENNYYIPLYLYEKYSLKGIFRGQKRLISAGQTELDEQEKSQKLNIQEDIINKLSFVYRKKFAPKKIFYYIYGLLYANTYRQKYQEFLKIDFPRIPFTKDVEIFEKISKLGKRLSDLHLLKDPILNNPITKFYGNNSNQVENQNYHKKKRRIYINEKQYFEPIEKETWEYMIGGYQVLDKWLKDRNIKKLNRGLNPDEIKHYCKVATAIKKTIEIQKEIDKIYSKVEKNLIKI